VAGWAHISRFIAGATSSGQRSSRPRQAQQAQQFVGAALRQLAMKSALAGRHQHGIGLARQVDVRHVVGLARVPLAGVDRPATAPASSPG
jgi:hypothetical protein